MNAKFKLGDEVRDNISGYTGVVVGVTYWLWNCITYGVTSRELKDGAPREAQWMDEERLELVEQTTHVPARATGGPTRHVPTSR